MKRKRWHPKRPYRRYRARRRLYKKSKHLSKAGMQLSVDRACKTVRVSRFRLSFLAL